MTGDILRIVDDIHEHERQVYEKVDLAKTTSQVLGGPENVPCLFCRKEREPVTES